MNWKEKLNKWFPKNRDMTDKQLRRERRMSLVMQGLALLSALFFCFLVFAEPLNPTVLERIAWTAFVVGGAAIGLTLYVMHRVNESEINFELRLREISDWKKMFPDAEKP